MDEARKKELDEMIRQLFLQISAELQNSVIPAFIRGNLQIQAYEGIRPSFQVAQTSAMDWFSKYRQELEEGGGTIQGEFIPWLEEWEKGTRQAFADIIDESLDEGWSMDRTAEEIGDALGVESSRAERMARTEVGRALFWGKMMRIEQAGYELARWRVGVERPDVEGPCDECNAANDFDMGYGPGIYPVEIFPEQPLHPNCRCTVTPVLSSLNWRKRLGQKPPVTLPDEEAPRVSRITYEEILKKVERLNELLRERRELG